MRYRRFLRTVAGLGLIAAASGAWQQVSPNAAGTLSIQTTPAEATAIVDGEVRGTTPLVLPSLSVGRHRVVLKRAGFLENGADVDITAGRTTALDRVLTPVPPEPRGATGRASRPPHGGQAAPPRESPPPQTASPPQRSSPVTRAGTGSGKKWALIGVAGGAGAAAAGFALTQKNAAPIPGTISISPSGTGMLGQTSFTIRSVGASDKDGNSLVYDWTFGDGGTGSGQSVTHTYGRTGTFTVALAVGDGRLTANAPPASVTIGQNLTGNWTGGSLVMPSSTGVLNVPCPITLTLAQSGASITGGTLTWTGACFGSTPLSSATLGPVTHPAAVTVTTSGTFTFNNSAGYVISFSGSTNAVGTNMSGIITLTRPSTGLRTTTNATFTKS